ncbi:MAG: PAS domain S-box protein, partial [Spirochaetales bacterium]|nr:PAS domain S-box protein [Spirochaetales bacterium]
PENDPFAFIQERVLKHTDFNGTAREFEELTEAFKTLSGSLAVIFNEVSLDQDFTISRAIAGLKQHWVKVSEILGIPLLNTSYNIDPNIMKAFRQDGLVEFDSLFDLSGHQVPKGVCNFLSHLFSIGKVFVLGLKIDERLLGDLIFLQQKGQDLQNRPMIELFGRHVALFLLQYRQRQSGFFQVLFDRMDSEQAGQSLVSSFYKATERLPDLVYQLNPEGRFVFVNHAVERYGYLRDELIGRSILDIVHPDDRERTHWSLKERRTGERKTVDVEVRFITGENNTVFFSVTEKEPVVRLYAEGLYDTTEDKNEFLGTLGICRDISAERDLEVRLNDQSEVFRIIAEHTDDAVWLEQINPPRIFYSNAAARALVGRVKDDVERNVTSYIDLVHQDDLPRVEEYISTLDSLIIPSEIEFRIMKDPATRWIRLRFFPVYYHDRVTNKRVGMASDITRFRLYQEDLVKEIEREKAYRKELNHRVKNNLAMIESLVFLEQATLSEEEEKTKNLLTDIRGRIRSIGLVHQMLYEMSRQGMIEIQEYLRNLAASIVHGGGPARNVPSLAFHFSGEYWMPVEEVIPLGMITNELITNALKYAFSNMQAGVITVSFREESEDVFLLAVEDNGLALPGEAEKKASSGIGRVLIDALVQQLQGEHRVVTTGGEKSFQVRFVSRSIRHHLSGD